MANTKISALTSGSALALTDIFPAVETAGTGQFRRLVLLWHLDFLGLLFSVVRRSQPPTRFSTSARRGTRARLRLRAEVQLDGHGRARRFAAAGFAGRRIEQIQRR